MKLFIIAFLLLSFFLANLFAKQCTVSYRFQKRCLHLDPKCIGQEKCTVLRTSLNNARCPIFRCVRISLFLFKVKWCCKMCYSREAYCQCCKVFLRLLKVNTCGLKSCVKTVFPKLSYKCQDCLKCTQICCNFKIPRKWIQSHNYYINRFVIVEEKVEILLFAESKCTYFNCHSSSGIGVVSVVDQLLT